MLRPDQRELARQVFYDYAEALDADGIEPIRRTDWYIDRMIEILEMRHPWLEGTELVEAKKG